MRILIFMDYERIFGNLEILVQQVNKCGHNFFVVLIAILACCSNKWIVHMISYKMDIRNRLNVVSAIFNSKISSIFIVFCGISKQVQKHCFTGLNYALWRGTYSKLLWSCNNCSVTIENLQDTKNLVYLLYSQDFKLLVGILYAIYSNPILEHCILFQPIRVGHTHAVR